MAQSSLLGKSSAATELSGTSPSPSNSAAGVKRKRPGDPKYYAVKVGKKPGVYHTWDECLAQVRGQKGAVFKSFASRQEAQSFVNGTFTPPASTTTSTGEQKFYAVQNGKVPGVYTDWPSAQAQIRGVRKPRHKKFSTRAEAEAFVAAGRRPVSVARNLASLGAEDQMFIEKMGHTTPGMILNKTHAPKDREGNVHPPGKGPMPPGTEDGFDPNIRLALDGTVVRKTEEEKRKTKMMPKEDPPGMLRIYTDGSSLKNGQAGARAGVGVFFGPQDPKNVSEALKGTRQTNQRAELTAILRALEVAPMHRDVTIYTDSQYAISCVTNWYKNWVKNKWTTAKGKPVENKDLVSEVREKIDEREYFGRGTLFVWVRGHAGDAGNIAADRLAVEGATMGRGVDEEVEAMEYLERAEAAAESVGGRDVSAQDEGEDEEARQAFQAMDQAYRAMDQAIESDDEFPA